ncbi:hypothetical protein DEO72_LG6g1069 [Vigna unguiculata]|uniref:Uncharacterized protein n=1 Tax=Vigna unguiculata TaxID=3917 RepID=A0A4D6M681_VIGUN|nr:hypothetical protein DEO72_LG6g1069 [Vigna unguiculata]
MAIATAATISSSTTANQKMAATLSILLAGSEPLWQHHLLRKETTTVAAAITILQRTHQIGPVTDLQRDHWQPPPAPWQHHHFPYDHDFAAPFLSITPPWNMHRDSEFTLPAKTITATSSSLPENASAAFTHLQVATPKTKWQQPP